MVNTLEVVRHQLGGPLQKPYLALVEQKYGASRNFKYFVNDLQVASRFSLERQQVECLAVLGGEHMLAHVALMRDPQAQNGRAYWGFFESSNDKDVFHLLWGALRTLAAERGVHKLLGPINGSIWHQYRVVKETDGSPFFKTELFCEPFYYDLLKEVCSTEVSYYSAYRTEFENLLSITEPFYERAAANGFSIAECRALTQGQLGRVLSISQRIFRTSWGYTDLAMADFAALYPAQKLATHLRGVYLLQKDDDIVGYGSVLLEERGSLILKAAAIVPEFRQLGLANALLYRIHRDAQTSRCKKVIYPLIREDNGVSRLPKDDAVIFRRYAAFETQT